jgi:hypothetical protein
MVRRVGMRVGLLSSRASVTPFIITVLNYDCMFWRKWSRGEPSIARLRRTCGNNSFIFIMRAMLVLIAMGSLWIITVSIRDYWSLHTWSVMRFWHALPRPAPLGFIGNERSILAWLRRTFVGGNDGRFWDSMGNESKRMSLTNHRRRGDRSNRDHSMGDLGFRHVHG